MIQASPVSSPEISKLSSTNSQQITRDKDKVKVILRIRPFEPAEQKEQFLTKYEQNIIEVNKPGGLPSLLKFNYVQHEQIGAAWQFGNESSGNSKSPQEKMFQSVLQAVECVFNGIDSTIFAYGQTGSGKTYTIVGNLPEINSDVQNYKDILQTGQRGVLPRALERVFREQALKKNSRVSISFFEIYNEKIFDLLNPTQKPLQIRQGKQNELMIQDLTLIEVINSKQVINYLAEGIKNRATSSTQANIKSSRSHSVFHIKYESLLIDDETGEYDVSVANLRIVDLAGSEKFNIPYDASPAEKEVKLLELKSINGSLSKLGHCISSLGSQSRTHIPFRDSKLTRILSDSLLGSGQIRLIVCVSPSTSSMQHQILFILRNQTASTLQFADRVKKAVFQKPVSSIQKAKYYSQEEFLQLQEQLQNQRSQRIQLQGLLKQLMDSKGCSNESLLKENYFLKEKIRQLVNGQQYQRYQTTQISQTQPILKNNNSMKHLVGGRASGGLSSHNQSKSPSVKKLAKNLNPNKSTTSIISSSSSKIFSSKRLVGNRPQPQPQRQRNSHGHSRSPIPPMPNTSSKRKQPYILSRSKSKNSITYPNNKSKNNNKIGNTTGSPTKNKNHLLPHPNRPSHQKQLNQSKSSVEKLNHQHVHLQPYPHPSTKTTPPKTPNSTSRTVYNLALDHEQRRSATGDYYGGNCNGSCSGGDGSNKNTKRNDGNGQYCSNSSSGMLKGRVSKILANNGNTMQGKLKSFVYNDAKGKDRNLEEKVRRRLQQIKKQLIQEQQENRQQKNNQQQQQQQQQKYHQQQQYQKCQNVNNQMIKNNSIQQPENKLVGHGQGYKINHGIESEQKPEIQTEPVIEAYGIDTVPGSTQNVELFD